MIHSAARNSCFNERDRQLARNKRTPTLLTLTITIRDKKLRRKIQLPHHYELRFLNEEASKPRRFTCFIYKGAKRCMLVSMKPGADFSRGCAHPAMQPLISATHSPTPLHELTQADKL